MRDMGISAGPATATKDYAGCYCLFQGHTMVPEDIYIKNLMLVDLFSFAPGSVVECGTWKGGMIAGIAKTLGPDRSYYLFDSYQGLPAAKDIDGAAAKQWQNDRTGPQYHDNCTASEDDSRAAMTLAGVSDWHVIPGWFEDTLKGPGLPEEIAILRLDGDWYDSTMTCLEALFPRVANGIVSLTTTTSGMVVRGPSMTICPPISRPSGSASFDTVAYILNR